MPFHILGLLPPLLDPLRVMCGRRPKISWHVGTVTTGLWLSLQLLTPPASLKEPWRYFLLGDKETNYIQVVLHVSLEKRKPF